MEVALELPDDLLALPLVHGHGRVEEGGFVLVLSGDRAQSGYVLGETRPAPADTRREEARAYALVEADAVGHLRDVRPDQLAEVGDLVDEADLGGQEGVGGVLDHLRARQVGGDE